MWRTTDGGATWEAQSAPGYRRALDFVDAQRGWAVGDWRNGQRTTIAHTKDGGQTWQIQDTHIAKPPLAYTTVARLDPYLTQQNPPLEALLAQLLLGPCSYEDRRQMPIVLYNLGWNGTDWVDPPDTPRDLYDVWRLDADLDGDEVEEIVFYGGGDVSDLFVGVLDWDGARWQIAWFERAGTRYNGNIRVYPDDLNGDGQPELWVEFLIHPSSGTGVLTQAWDISVLHCTHLRCHLVWTETLSRIGRGFSSEFNISYSWSGSDYRFIEQNEDAWPKIELQRYGSNFSRTPTGELLSSTLEMQILPTTQTLYHWDGVQYTPTAEIELAPGYTLDTRPLTETLDLDGDGDLEQAVYRWTPDCDGLWQTLTLYDRDTQGAWQPTQVFTAAITGSPSEGLFMQDVHDDGRIEIITCATSFLLTYELTEAEEWPSMQPRCTVIDLTGFPGTARQGK